MTDPLALAEERWQPPLRRRSSHRLLLMMLFAAGHIDTDTFSNFIRKVR